MDRRTFLGTAAAAAISTGLHPIPSFATPDAPNCRRWRSACSSVPTEIPKRTIKRVHDMGFTQLLSVARRLHRQVHAGCCEADQRSAGEVRGGRHDRRSRGSAAARVELSAGAFDDRPRSAEDACCAHRRAAAGVGLRETARHLAGANALRIHSRGSGRRALSRARSKRFAPSRSTATATASTS